MDWALSFFLLSLTSIAIVDWFKFRRLREIQQQKLTHDTFKRIQAEIREGHPPKCCNDDAVMVDGKWICVWCGNYVEVPGTSSSENDQFIERFDKLRHSLRLDPELTPIQQMGIWTDGGIGSSLDVVHISGGRPDPTPVPSPGKSYLG